MSNINGKSTLVCIIGQLRALEITHESIMQKVIEPLNADLLICVSRLSEKDEDVIKCFKTANIIDVCIYDDGIKYAELSHKFGKGFKHNEWRKYKEIKDNWLGGIDERPGSGLYLSYNYWKLLENLRDLESRNISYERYIITRSDFMWVVEHPPLNLLSPRFIWIPEGEDYYGYNDRHAVCSKKNITRYLSMFEYMLDSRAMKYLGHEKTLNHEKHLKLHLDSNFVMVGRFKNVAYLTGGQKTPSRWKSVKSIDLNGKTYSYKYRDELENALKNAKEFERHKDWNQMISRPLFVREAIRLLMMKTFEKFPWLSPTKNFLKIRNNCNAPLKPRR